jgi:hypothetical protein
VPPDEIEPENGDGIAFRADSNSTPASVSASQTQRPTPSSIATNGSSITSYTPIEELMPFPKAGPRKGKGVRKRMKSQILTDTPVLNRMR